VRWARPVVERGSAGGGCYVTERGEEDSNFVTGLLFSSLFQRLYRFEKLRPPQG
jgi:hypothetical protein